MNFLRNITSLITPSTVKCDDSPLDAEMPFDPMYYFIFIQGS